MYGDKNVVFKGFEDFTEKGQQTGNENIEGVTNILFFTKNSNRINTYVLLK